MYIVWRVDAPREPYHKTIEMARREAKEIIDNEEKEAVLIVKVIERVRRRRPRIEIVSEPIK